MRLTAQLDSTTRHATCYTLHPETGKRPLFDNDDEKSHDHFRALQEPIESMARRVLTDDFLSIELGGYQGGVLYLIRFKPGTASRRKTELKNFFGWLNLFDSTPTAAAA